MPMGTHATRIGFTLQEKQPLVLALDDFRYSGQRRKQAIPEYEHFRCLRTRVIGSDISIVGPQYVS